jgi:hypothetical protein
MLPTTENTARNFWNQNELSKYICPLFTSNIELLNKLQLFLGNIQPCTIALAVVATKTMMKGNRQHPRAEK